jgi:uncharacterized repeat protein (TIGR02543 family)
MKHKILGIAVLLCAVFLAACSDLVDELTPKETYYKIEIPSEIENGKVSADKTSARAGDTVKLTLSASEGYKYSSLTVTGANNAAVPVTAIKTGEVYTFTMPASAVKISAAFIPIPTYKVTFSTDGGTEAAEQTVEENGRAEKPSDPAKDGFTFAGWYTSADGGATLSETVFDFNTPITADITLYAKWIDATVPVYKVTIADGIENGTVSASADTAAEGTIITLTAKPTSGYTLSAYSVKDAEENPVSVTTGGSFTMPASNVTVYATFTELPPDAANYTVKHLFQKVDASGYEQNTSDYPDETKAGTAGVQTAASAKTVTGFTAQSVTQKTIAADGSTVVEIKYDRNSNIVTYKDGADGNIAVPEGSLYRYGQAVTVSFTGIGARPGYLFTGWKQGNATYKSDGDTSFTMGDSPVTLIAQWTKIGTTFAVTISESTGDFSLESAADGTKLTFTAVGTDSGANLVWKVYKDNTALAAYKKSGPDTAFSFDTGSLEAGSYTLFVTSGTRSAAAVFTVPKLVVTLKTGSEINAILRTNLSANGAKEFKKSDVTNEEATLYLDTEKKIPVWYDSGNKIIYYYVPDNCIAMMNADSSQMFINMYGLTSLDLSEFNTSNVTSMEKMFCFCSQLEHLNLSGFDTSSVTNMKEMFRQCDKLASISGLSSFDTSKVENMAGMFSLCQAFTSLDVSNFNTTNVTDMHWMFYYCSALKNLDLSNFNTSKVTSMNQMFYNCDLLENLTVSSFDTKCVTDMYEMFDNCKNLTSLDLSSFNTGKVTTMEEMFRNCVKLESLDLSSFDTSNVINMSCMFMEDAALADLNISGFNTGKTTNMSSMFADCSSLTKLDLSSFDTTANKDSLNVGDMFRDCSSLVTIYATDGFTATGELYLVSGCFDGCTNLVGGAGTTYDEDIDEGWFARIDGGDENKGYFTKSPNSHTITFDANGGSLTITTRTVKAGTATALTTAEALGATYSGHSFNGWNTASDGSGTSYADGAIVTLSGNITLYAQWKAILATDITLNASSMTIYYTGCSSYTHSGTVSVSNVTPDDADKTVTWSSDNTNVATVNASTGEVIVGAGGTANITAEANSGVSATCEVTSVDISPYYNALTEAKENCSDIVKSYTPLDNWIRDPKLIKDMAVALAKAKAAETGKDYVAVYYKHDGNMIFFAKNDGTTGGAYAFYSYENKGLSGYTCYYVKKDAVTYIGTKAPSEAKTVGDIVFSDGSATPYTADLTLTEEQKAAAIAVIFYVGTECSNDSASRTLGVGLAQNQSGLAWCLDSAKACNVNITTIKESDKDGSDNLSQIGEFLDENNDTGIADKYPAFYFAKNYASQTGSNVSGTDYADGWYLPAKAELQKIYDILSTVNKELAACGGTEFNSSGVYWSSTQYASDDTKAYVLVFNNGGWGNNYKYNGTVYNYVCAVREFN